MIRDLEVWLVGTATDIDAAVAALSSAGRFAGASRPEPLYGDDAGRFRRLTVAPAVVDLSSRRRSA
jgi:hypothetical protein